MENELISLETAILAKQAGFNEPCKGFAESKHGDVLNFVDDKYYVYRGYKPFKSEWMQIIDEDNGKDTQFYIAPEQSLLQRWLRQEHGVHIEILLEEDAPYNKFYYRIMKVGQYFTLSHDALYFEKYEDALETALLAVLKLIIHKA